MNSGQLPDHQGESQQQGGGYGFGISPNINSGSTPTSSAPQSPSIQGENDGEKSSKRGTYRRSYKACLNCRQRKVKCDLGDISNPGQPPCARCRREGKECTFTDSKRGGVNNVRLGREKRALESTDDVFANKSSRTEGKPQAGVKASSTGGSDDLISQKELHNTTDALEILAHAARSFPKINKGHGSNTNNNNNNLAKVNNGAKQNCNTNSSGTTKSSKQPTQEPETARLVDTDLIAKEKILTEYEAKELIKYFFESLHPFYPYIPESLHTPESLAEVPILLASITTLSSRYYALDADDGKNKEKYVELHNKLWDYCQRMITKTVWAEASTRSIGTVFSFLLFSEWNPRAIHQRWQDYANYEVHPNNNNNSTDFGITGLSASRRSDRLAWMLLGSGIRLAQDLGLMETSSKVYLATHVSEIVLALRMGRKSMLSQSLNEPIPENLEFTQHERANLDLLQIMSLAHETLYGSRTTTRELLRNGSFLTFLALFGPHLDNWEHTYGDLLNDNTLERESLLFDYQYARLYIYSLALYSNSDPGNNKMSSVAQIIPSSRYVAMATDAAKELMASAKRVHARGMLKRAPVRWIVRIVHATVFLVKSIMLTPTSSLEAHRHTVAMIRTISRTLIESSPDEVHLSKRYGNILLELSNHIASKVDEEDEDENPDINETAIDDEEGDTKNTSNTNEDIENKYNPKTTTQHIPQHEPQQQRTMSENMFEFSRYSFPLPQQETPITTSYENFNQSILPNSATPGFATPQQNQDDANQNLLSVLDMDFDFLMEGTEGLGFVEPLMEGIEQHQMLKRQRG